MKCEETGCTRDRPQFRLLHVSVEGISEVHNTMTTVTLHSTRSISRNLNAPKTTVLQILCSFLWIYSHRFQRVEALEPGEQQQHVNFANFFLIDMMKIASSRSGYYGRRRHSSPSLGT